MFEDNHRLEDLQLQFSPGGGEPSKICPFSPGGGEPSKIRPSLSPTFYICIGFVDIEYNGK